jgi:hypothetical protein
MDTVRRDAVKDDSNTFLENAKTTRRTSAIAKLVPMSISERMKHYLGLLLPLESFKPPAVHYLPR